MSMASKGKDSVGCVGKSVLRSSCTVDNVGVYINVSCGSASGQLYLDRLGESKQSLAKCILVGGAWYTPPEFESFGGKRAKKWKKSLQHLGKPLGDFNLSCPPRQGVQHGLNVAWLLIVSAYTIRCCI